MRFNIVSSGSKGNATIIQSKNTVLLVDMGITLTRLNEGLKEFNLELKDIDGAVFTHNHSDHIGGIRFLSPSIMYGLEGTLPPLCHKVNLFEPFVIGDFTITPLITSHDANNPCGYFFSDGEETLFYMTDTGYFIEDNLPICQNPDYIIIESNHDIKMLLKTNRTYELKTRIMSMHGHLCNEDSALACVKIIGNKTKQIVLAHLSEEANTPEVALAAYERIFKEMGININKFMVKCANQHVSLIGGHDDEN